MQTWLHVLDWRATSDADALALCDDRVRWTYGDVRRRVEERAGGWHDLGVRDGDVVAVLAHNSAEFLVQVLALARIGALPLLLNWRMTAPEVRRLLDLTDPVAVFADEAGAALVDPDASMRRVLDGPPVPGWTPVDALVGTAPPRPVARLLSGQTAFLMHSSGTTGEPKVIPLDHGSLIRSLSGFAIDIGDQVRGSRHLIMMPMFHLAGFAQAMQCLLTGGVLFVQDGFDVDRAIDAIAAERIEFFTAAPTLIEMLVDALEGPRRGADVSSLREVQYGAAPIEPELLGRALAVICDRFRQIYGSTELQGFLSVLRPEDHVPGTPQLASAGQVALGWEARVVGADEVVLEPGRAGELQIRGEGVITGYWRNREETAAAWTADGWYRTGDLAVLGEDGYLAIVGRAKDMIISGGENVYPAEIERALLEHPAILEAAVVGCPHPKWGETPLAFVVVDPGASPTDQDLIAHCRQRLAGFKCPSAVRIVPELPRNTLGKVLKTELRESAAHAVPSTPNDHR